MRHTLKILMSLSVFFSVTLTAQPTETLDQDEAGIWMIVDKQEQSIRTSPLHVDDEELQQELNFMVCKLRQSLCGLMRPYIVRVAGFNASMAPNGAMYVQTGLLLRAKSNAELATVLGHEISHYEREHTLENFRRYNRTANGFAVVGALLSAASTVSIYSATDYQSLSQALDLSNTAFAMLTAAQIYSVFQLLAFNRSQEAEADVDGINYMYEANYDPNEAVQIWQRLKSEEDAGEDEAGFSLFATHPSIDQRISEIRRISSGLQAKSYAQTRTLVDLVDNYRIDWLNDELFALDPKQFAYLVNTQEEFGIPRGYIKYLEASAWMKHAQSEELSRRETEDAYQSAIEGFQAGFDADVGFPNEAFRDWGRAYLALDNTERAKWAFEEYLNREPDAWDSRFIRRDLEKL